ncbi:MAG: TIGR02646 family protein, partial [Pedobacter sp.]
MIAVKRPSEVPAFMKSGIFLKMKRDLKKFYNVPQDQRRQQKPPYIPFPASVLEKIRTQLHKEFNGKCAYCESLITISYQGDVDHFRPKSAARGLTGEFSLDHYWPLAFDWRNMYLCCEICNRYKVNWFPVDGSRANLKLNFQQIRATEKPYLIDPCHDNPEEYFQYRENGTITGVNERAKVSIDVLKLNRKDLLENRRIRIRDLNALLAKLI